MQTVCVMGLGYIGLPTASILAANGFKVLGVDISERVVDTVNSGQVHIEEPGLQTLVKAAIGSGNLRAAREPDKADIFILAVPTPVTADKTVDLGSVTGAARSIAPCLSPGNLVILESTSPPGTCRDVLTPMLSESGWRPGEDIHLAYCPERVLPGNILRELIANDRVVGGYDQTSAERARDMYATFVEGEIVLTDLTTAEMVKVTENTFRDVNIALANETALICETLGTDFWEVARLANRHPRVNLHQAGPGVGGHCIPVDPWFLVEQCPQTAELIHLARRRNDGMPARVIARIVAMVKGIAVPKVALLGLAFKDDVDDTRGSPALEVAAGLQKAGIHIAVHDPHVDTCPFPLCGIEDALSAADCLVILTGHSAFRRLDPRTAARLMRGRLLYDTRNVIDHDDWREAGFEVHLLGSGKPILGHGDAQE
jgi:UDP-N-acetyl-D-mannosaminuronic acid dehydrogenase